MIIGNNLTLEVRLLLVLGRPRRWEVEEAMEEDEEVRDDMAGQTNKNKRELKIQLTEENKRSCGF